MEAPVRVAADEPQLRRTLDLGVAPVALRHVREAGRRGGGLTGTAARGTQGQAGQIQGQGLILPVGEGDVRQGEAHRSGL